jgi:O-antigen ligase
LYTFVIFCTLSISITQISFAIGVLAWLIKVHLTKTWDKIYGTPVGLPILCFCLASILAVITSVDYTASLPHLKKIFQFAILFWVANTVTNEKQKDLLIKLLIISGVIASIFGLSQAWSTAVTLQTRVSGTMSVYMTFAGLLMLVSLIALGRFLFNDTKEKWIMVAIGLIIFCLFLTLTRQAWLGFFVGLLVLIIFWNKKYLLALPVAMMGLLLFAPESVKDRMLSIIDLSDWTFQARIFLWQGGLEIFKDYPITGCGFKCVDVLHTQYPDPSGYIAKYRGMHNNIIQLLVDTGILGLGTWLSIWVAYFLNTYKQWNKTTINGISKGLVIGSLAAVTGFLAGGMFETNFYDSEIAMLLFFIMGLSLAETSKKVAL